MPETSGDSLRQFCFEPLSVCFNFLSPRDISVNFTNSCYFIIVIYVQ